MKMQLFEKNPEKIKTLTKQQKLKLDELLFKEEKNGEKRVNRITFITSIVFLIIIFSIIGIVGYSPNSTANLIGISIFFLYNLVMFILLKKDIYLPFFKYITVFINVTTIILCLYLYSYFTGWVHALRTISLIIMFVVISLSGFYQRPRVPIFAAVLVSIEYALLFFYAVFFTDIQMYQMETFEIPAISIDLVIVYCSIFLIVGFIVSYITRRLQILLERSLHFEAEIFLKKEIEKAHKKLKEMDQYKTLFFQNITHEFRTPLTLILGPLDSILNTHFGSISEKVKEELFIIRRNAKRLLLLVNQLLDLSKIESKKTKLKAGKTEIINFIKRIIASYQSYAERNHINLRLESKNKSLYLYLDQEKIEKVIHNLLSNAFKFVKKGGEIAISISGLIDISEISHTEMFKELGVSHVSVIKVLDTGIGIPEKEMSNIFNRFHQVNGSSTRDAGGTGIGLSLAKEYIELHYGLIEVTSKTEKFTEFSIFLPAGKNHLKIDEMQAENDLPNKSTYEEIYFTFDIDRKSNSEKEIPKKRSTEISPVSSLERVLIVEDNIDMRKYIKDILEDKYLLFEAKNGEEGFDAARKLLPDLIISDVMMPKMDGNQLLATLKENKSTSKIPVIIITAKASLEFKIDKLEKGADDYLSKPFNPRELLARVKNLLATREYEKIIVSKNKRILDSINYAKRIQLSILPKTEYLNQIIREYFVTWKPRDIVGGDFYWCERVNDKKYILAVIDCTGHGVPGAVMTMTANSVLTRIVADYVNDNPAKILENLNILIKDTLKQNVKNPLSNDGMDVSLCYVNTCENTILFAGARHSLFYSENGSIIEIPGDKQSVGYKKSKINYKYTNHKIKLDNSFTFYLASDGYFEQNNPENNYSMGKMKFKNILNQCCNLPMDKQKEFLEKKLKEFQKDQQQRDDITVFGFRV